MFENKDIIKILSIDGGGVRGLIPAILLCEIEKKTGKQIHELFDFFSGTSTGGIITLMMTKPNPVSTEELIDIYGGAEAQAIFAKNIFTPLKYISKGPKYNKKGIEEVLEKRLGNYLLQNSIKPVLIPTYDLETRNTYFFSSYDTKYQNLSMKQAARATSAAPTYFEPIKIEKYGTFIDGGLAVNNPAMAAYVEVVKLLKKENISPESKRILVVSIGTGSATNQYSYDEIKKWTPLDWLKGPLMSTFFDGNNDTVEYQLKQLLHKEDYYRFQVRLPDKAHADEMDNTDKKNLTILKTLSENYINNDDIQGIPIGWYSKLQNLYLSLQP